jgi:hypothetical protein
MFRLIRFCRGGADLLIRMLNAVVWPPLELLMRLWLARLFFVSGLFNLMHSQLRGPSGRPFPRSMRLPDWRRSGR